MNTDPRLSALNGEVKLTAKKLKRQKRNVKVARIMLIILVIIMLIGYLIFSTVYNGYNFTISLDRNLYYDNHLIIYDDPDYKVYRQKLQPESLEYFDNIYYEWLPDDLDSYDGSHNGDNFLAYSFYIENTGENVEDFYASIDILDVIKNVDDAIRFMVYYDGEPTIYAKISPDTGKAEPNTTPFESEKYIMRQHVENFMPGDKHKYTIVIWIEGSDTECTNNIIGGEFRAKMSFKSEFVD